MSEMFPPLPSLRAMLSCLWIPFIMMLYISFSPNSFKRETLDAVTLIITDETHETHETRNLMQYAPSDHRYDVLASSTNPTHIRQSRLLSIHSSTDDDSNTDTYYQPDVVFATERSKIYRSIIMREETNDEPIYRNLICDTSKTTPIHVLLTVDRQYKHAFYALFNSIIQHSCNVSRLHFHVLLDCQKRREIKAFVKQFERLFVKQPVEFNYEFKSPYIEYPQFLESFHYFQRRYFHRFLKPINFARFYLGDIFSEVQIGIYLDSDMIVLADIAHLVDDNEVNDKYPVYAVLEHNPRTLNHEGIKLVSNLRKRRRFMQAIQPMIAKYNLSEDRIQNVLDVKTKTFNNGVMVLNLNYWRKHKMREQAEFLVQMDERTQRRFFQIGNQVIFNVLFLFNDGNIGALNRYWNIWGLASPEWCNDSYVSPQMKGLLDKAYILHYAGAEECKPWMHAAKDLIVSKYFWDYQV